MIVREATKDDSKWILRHRLGMFKDMGESEDFVEETRLLTEGYLKKDWTKHYRYFLIEDDGQVIGGCGLSTFRIPPMAHQKSGLYSYLSNMFVEPEHRGKGVGRKLLIHVIDYCRAEDIGIILLHASNLGYPLYTSEGFNSPDWLLHLLVKRHRS
jgi:GNAT superfamily N-acetyltransferase